MRSMLLFASVWNEGPEWRFQVVNLEIVKTVQSNKGLTKTVLLLNNCNTFTYIRRCYDKRPAFCVSEFSTNSYFLYQLLIIVFMMIWLLKRDNSRWLGENSSSLPESKLWQEYRLILTGSSSRDQYIFIRAVSKVKYEVILIYFIK